jgi:acyl-CoA thioesterase-1
MLVWQYDAAWAQAPALPQDSMNIRAVVYGDGLVSGYKLHPDQSLAAKLNRRIRQGGFTNVTVMDMSGPSETTGTGVERLRTLLDQKPDIVIVALGDNDGREGISIEIAYKNLLTIVSVLSQRKIYVILVGYKAPADKGYVYDKRFEAMYTNLQDTFGFAFYPFVLNGIVDNQDMSMADGYHPNNKGMEMMSEQIYPLLDGAVRWAWTAKEQHQEWMEQRNEEGAGISTVPGIPTPPQDAPVTAPIPH